MNEATCGPSGALQVVPRTGSWPAISHVSGVKDIWHQITPTHFKCLNPLSSLQRACHEGDLITVGRSHCNILARMTKLFLL